MPIQRNENERRHIGNNCVVCAREPIEKLVGDLVYVFSTCHESLSFDAGCELDDKIAFEYTLRLSYRPYVRDLP
jgi:hypothetical protein